MDKNNLSEIKKLFTKYGSVNFFKEYTLQDVEEAKKKSFIALCLENNNIEQIQNYLDSSALQLVEHKFNNNDLTLGAGITLLVMSCYYLNKYYCDSKNDIET